MTATRLVAVITAMILFLPAPLRASELVRAHPDLAAKFPGIKSVVLLPPRISMYEIGAGGTVEAMEDWGTAAQANVSRAFSTNPLPLVTFQVTELDEQTLSPSVRDTYDETRLLYEVVGDSIKLHTSFESGPSLFPEKILTFVYSLGSEIQQLAPEADAFLIIEGFDQRSSVGRKVLQAGTTLIGLVLGAIVIPRGGNDLMTVALVEAKTGTILWFYRTTAGYDLRDASSAAQFAEDALKTLPGHEQQAGVR
ncbi:MAG TPA: hypothetical protein VF819_06180 [Nitrospira sp.]